MFHVNNNNRYNPKNFHSKLNLTKEAIYDLHCVHKITWEKTNNKQL